MAAYELFIQNSALSVTAECEVKRTGGASNTSSNSLAFVMSRRLRYEESWLADKAPTSLAFWTQTPDPLALVLKVFFGPKVQVV